MHSIKLKHMLKFESSAVIFAVLALSILVSQPALAYPIEGNAVVTESAEIKAGITPDSPFYGLDRAIDSLSIALSREGYAKAEKGITIARERLMETKMRLEANDTSAAEKAQRGHARALASVQASIDKMEDSDVEAGLEDEIKLEKELLEHESEILAVSGSGKANAETNTGVDAKQVTLMFNAMENDMADVKARLLEKKIETALALMASGEYKGTNVIVLEQEGGLLELRMRRAADEINVSGDAIADAKADVSAKLKAARAEGPVEREDVSAAAAAAQVLLQADLKLHAAEEAFAAARFEQALELASTARKLAESARMIFIEELEDDAAAYASVKAESKTKVGGAGVEAEAAAETDVKVILR